MPESTSVPPGHSPLSTPLTRRLFLTGTAAASLAAVMTGRSQMTQELLSAVGRQDAGPQSAVGLPGAGLQGADKLELATTTPTPSFTFAVARDTDLVLLDFKFYEFEQKLIDGVTSLVPTSPSNVITVQFPPQAIGEAAYPFPSPSPPAPSGSWNVDPPPVLSVMSAHSLLCFTLHAGGRRSRGQSVRFTTMTSADLLDWSEWTLLVPTNAQQGKTPTSPSNPRDASTPVTYVEYPYGLFLCPTVYAEPATSAVPKYTTTFVGKTEPLMGANGISDLWIAALQQTAVQGGAALLPTVAALWARDFPSTSQDETPKNNISYQQ
jgi:hypothetical protein